MTPKVKEITGEDLLKLEIKINDEQQKARHQQNNNIQQVMLAVDDLETESKLTNQTLGNMNKQIETLSQKTEYGFEKIEKKIETFVEGLENKFVSKNDHNDLKEKVGLIYKAFYWLIGIVFTAIVGALLYNIGIGIK